MNQDLHWEWGCLERERTEFKSQRKKRLETKEISGYTSPMGPQMWREFRNKFHRPWNKQGQIGESSWESKSE